MHAEERTNTMISKIVQPCNNYNSFCMTLCIHGPTQHQRLYHACSAPCSRHWCHMEILINKIMRQWYNIERENLIKLYDIVQSHHIIIIIIIIIKNCYLSQSCKYTINSVTCTVYKHARFRIFYNTTKIFSLRQNKNQQYVATAFYFSAAAPAESASRWPSSSSFRPYW